MSNKRKEDSILSYFQKKIKPSPESNVPLPQRDTDETVGSQNLILVSTYSNKNFNIPIITKSYQTNTTR